MGLMRGASNLQRSLTKLAVHGHQQIHSRSKAGHYYELCERDQQFQHEFVGTLAALPVESKFKIMFDIMFVWDAGVRRDSQLAEPLFRSGFSFTKEPKGIIPYARVSKWIQDDDLNYVGAEVTVGVHSPYVSSTKAVGLKFAGMFHGSFQGFGMPIDAEGGGDANADPGSDTPDPTTGSGGTSPGDTPSAPTPPGNPQGTVAPPGQLTRPGVSWQQVASLSGTPISGFVIPAGEGPMTIAGGVLTTADAHAVEVYATNDKPGSHPTAPDNRGGFWYHGDKYAALWAAPGRLASGYKLRAHFLSRGTIVQAVVVNMANGPFRNRYGSTATGLAVWFAVNGIGWTTDLRKLGTVQQDVGDKVSAGQNYNWLIERRLPGPEYEWLSQAGQPSEYWVEVWRDGNDIRVGVWLGDPDTSSPIHVFSRSVIGDPQFGPGVAGYWGLTCDRLPAGQGVKDLTLYKAV